MRGDLGHNRYTIGEKAGDEIRKETIDLNDSMRWEPTVKQSWGGGGANFVETGN